MKDTTTGPLTQLSESIAARCSRGLIWCIFVVSLVAWAYDSTIAVLVFLRFYTVVPFWLNTIVLLSNMVPWGIALYFWAKWIMASTTRKI